MAANRATIESHYRQLDEDLTQDEIKLYYRTLDEKAKNEINYDADHPFLPLFYILFRYLGQAYRGKMNREALDAQAERADTILTVYIIPSFYDQDGNIKIDDEDAKAFIRSLKNLQLISKSIPNV